MSNVKEIEIAGSLPFNFDDDDDLLKLIGRIHSPSLGLRMTFSNSYYLSNMHGGKTSMYHFSLEGAEALSDPNIAHMVRTFSKHGPVNLCRLREFQGRIGRGARWINRTKEWSTDEWKQNFKDVPDAVFAVINE